MKSKIYFKFTTEKDEIDGVYKDGLNIYKTSNTITNISSDNKKEGITYLDPSKSARCLYRDAKYLRIVRLHKDTVSVKQDYLNDNGRFWADKLYLGKRFELSDPFTIMYMIKMGYNVRERDDYMLEWACAGNFTEVARYLLKIGANPGTNKYACFESAVRNGNYDMVKLLLENIPGSDKFYYKMLEVFKNKSRYCGPEISKLFFNYVRDCDIDYIIRHDTQKLYVLEDTEFVKSLVGRGLGIGKFIDRTEPKFDKYYLECVVRGFLDTMKYFDTIDTTIVTRNQQQLIEKAVLSKNLDVFKYLEQNIDVGPMIDDLILKCMKIDLFVFVKYMIEKYNVINVLDTNKLIENISLCCNMEMIEYMTNLTGISIPETQGLLTNACQYNNSELVKYLLEKGANVNEFNGKPLREAIKNNNKDIIKNLMDYSPDISLDNYAAIRESFATFPEIAKKLAVGISIEKLHEIIFDQKIS
ncbi:putative ankyrin repeat protein [Acanthamoeba castellanii mimivirus]|uniref:Putative ankyrin repeat protein L279 n=5 Tax=Mimivirus TaxID=315393 RepID=YL279_MIMIV|nr:putative ankyrin repeat protein [Acanthamoeba polyphaga mimivirus]Q5UPV5.1 RecName: Full=Putative ankyrin repeat protein L279 [Acanthamoeba polyphaga mimivirus]ALR83860.1 ankyrin repeat protein [Niemeyer virus]AMK61844.1 ankyrin repeat protein [Samba virus]AMZ02728.1 putative ankyrin repeat protein [Mimivirus Bombay]BAV61378.1 putative ankyrin repeat protein [Acanthamoeba castellanii mimivirus]AAV50551.1 unknown [Acanthamoeba polyphaga mimivirus]